MKKLLIVLLTLCILLTVGCTQIIEASTNKVISMGEMNDHTYTNDYFGLEFSLPQSWTILTEDEIEIITQAGAELVADGNEELEEELELSEVKTLNLVYSYKHDLSYAEAFNPSISCIAENLGLAGVVIRSGEDYLDQVVALFEEAGMPVTVNDIAKEKLDSVEFDVLNVTIDYGIAVYQKYYSTVMDGYALNFIISYTSEDELAEFDSILETVTFE